jgi:hypothetical protein
MFSIDFVLAVALYLLIFLAVIFFIGVTGNKQKDKDLSLDPRLIWFCSICSYTYINTKEGLLSVCPRCGSYNKKTVDIFSNDNKINRKEIK